MLPHTCRSLTPVGIGSVGWIARSFALIFSLGGGVDFASPLLTLEPQLVPQLLTVLERRPKDPRYRGMLPC